MFLAKILRNIAIIFLICVNLSFSQIAVSIPNVFLERGREDTIFVFAKFPNLSFNKLNVVFQFNAYLIDFKGVVFCQECIISDSNPNFIIQLNQLENATLSISSSKINLNANNDILFKLVAEGLVYKDSLDTIKLVQLEIDDNPTSFNFDGGIIVVRGPSIIPVKKNYLSESFPLPTTDRVFFRFGFVVPSFLEIEVKNSIGEKVLKSTENVDFFKILGPKGIVPVSDKLNDGDYLLELSLPPDFPSGNYFLQLNAFSIGVFYSKFLVVK